MKKERHVLIRFDLKARQITNSINGFSWRMPIQADIMDKLVYQLIIMYELEKESIEYMIADGGKIKTYNFNLLGEEWIQTPMGQFTTLKLKRHRQDSKRQTTLQCTKELRFLPIKG